jgi:hypothetical protein
MRAIFLFVVLCLVIILCGADYARRYPTNTALEVMGVVAAPAAPNAACSVGQVAYDSSYIYICTAANTWSRGTIATWAVTRTLVNWGGIQVQWQGADVQR